MKGAAFRAKTEYILSLEELIKEVKNPTLPETEEQRWQRMEKKLTDLERQNEALAAKIAKHLNKEKKSKNEMVNDGV
jgi:hypothetical protein